MKSLRKQRGVTLVEACVATTIGAIIASTAAPSFQGFIEKQRLEGAAAQLAADIQFARTEAVMRNGGVRLTVQSQPWGSCYIIHSGAANDCSCSLAGPAQCSGEAQQIKTVRLLVADHVGVQSNVRSILFDPLHGTSTPAGTLKLVADSGRAVHHVVNVMGRVRSCSPQGSAPALPGYTPC